MWSISESVLRAEDGLPLHRFSHLLHHHRLYSERSVQYVQLLALYSQQVHTHTWDWRTMFRSALKYVLALGTYDVCNYSCVCVCVLVAVLRTSLRDSDIHWWGKEDWWNSRRLWAASTSRCSWLPCCLYHVRYTIARFKHVILAVHVTSHRTAAAAILRTNLRTKCTTSSGASDFPSFCLAVLAG